MKRSPLLNTELSFSLVWKKRKYTVDAQLDYDGDGVERWSVVIAGREFYFQNNRPHLATTGNTRAVNWQIIKGFEYIQQKPEQSDDAVELRDEMQQQIERLSAGKKVYDTFQDVRNKVSS